MQVYEHLVFEGHEHVSLQRLPGMQDRCIRIGSAGKTFSLTGWKVLAIPGILSLLPELATRCCPADCLTGAVLQIGWCTGPAELVSAVAKAHSFITFTVPSSLQRAVAYGLDHEAGFYT